MSVAVFSPPEVDPHWHDGGDSHGPPDRDSMKTPEYATDKNLGYGPFPAYSTKDLTKNSRNDN